MSVTSWLAVVLFLLFVAPGLWFDLLSDRWRANPEESSFREAGRVVLASVLASGCMFGILLWVRTYDWGRRWLLDPALLVANPQTYLVDSFGLVAKSLLVQTVGALALVYVTHRAMSWLHGGSNIYRFSAWNQVFKVERPEGTFVYAYIWMNDGQAYAGPLITSSPTLAQGDRELVLGSIGTKVICYQSPKEAKFREMKGYRRLVLRGEAIRGIAVAYLPKEGSKSQIGPTKREVLRQWLGRRLGVTLKSVDYGD